MMCPRPAPWQELPPRLQRAYEAGYWAGRLGQGKDSYPFRARTDERQCQAAGLKAGRRDRKAARC
jgi:ribosome modulation factor